jgi:hypothetical protein
MLIESGKCNPIEEAFIIPHDDVIIVLELKEEQSELPRLH